MALCSLGFILLFTNIDARARSAVLKGLSGMRFVGPQGVELVPGTRHARRRALFPRGRARAARMLGAVRLRIALIDLAVPAGTVNDVGTVVIANGRESDESW